LERCICGIDQARHFTLLEELRQAQHLLRIRRLGNASAPRSMKAQCSQLRDHVRSQLQVSLVLLDVFGSERSVGQWK
jgi:hypothetical protein